MKPVDFAIYCWTILLIVVISVAFPPALFALILFPRWHAKRVRDRRARAEAARLARRAAWLDSL